MWLVANAVLRHQLRSGHIHASAQARNTYFIHRYGERLDVAEEESTQRTVILLGLALVNGVPLVLGLLSLLGV